MTTTLEQRQQQQITINKVVIIAQTELPLFLGASGVIISSGEGVKVDMFLSFPYAGV